MASALERIRDYQHELVALRHDLHAHPEIGLDTPRTAEIVARQLEGWGIEVHRCVGGHGVVGVLRQGNGPIAIGLRADMDALLINEATGLAYQSESLGRMHACGHDGHTTMLLGCARYLAETRAFSGTVNFIFQPGEEGAGGALAMLADGLFERFPCDAIYGLHPIGHFVLTPGQSNAGGAFFDIMVTGRGSHGARPETSIDPVLTACHMGAALQSIVSRNLKPGEKAVVSVTQLHAGNAYNVIPETATLAGTARAMSRAALSEIETAIRRIAEGVAEAFGAKAHLDHRLIFAPLINDDVAAQGFADTAAELVGDSRVDRAMAPRMGSEDFSFMLEKVPGAFIYLGNGENCASLHNPRYDFNDDAIPFGAALFSHLVERTLV
jgi:amidohydrolase